jgi:hypothetical protein
MRPSTYPKPPDSPVSQRHRSPDRSVACEMGIGGRALLLLVQRSSVGSTEASGKSARHFAQALMLVNINARTVTALICFGVVGPERAEPGGRSIVARDQSGGPGGLAGHNALYDLQGTGCQTK